ncbi:DsbA family protein [Rhizorhapis suberifaciens]|uniref:Protein-disulfide isomerase n=1 Tax=Rhizorhapis suberifaciens TaxID=13656 RepID=A0A840HWM8_9SPHN|nr:thioredoxin domain-containing protein [Rhizorhapis suberifaciens]MBB4641814.1 protein-disulfide isomerase [Rhizorhapis suberifaciens]
MNKITLMSSLALALALTACGDKDTASEGMPSGKPIAAVPAPAGTNWADTVKATADGGFIMGNPNAPIKIVEFASLTCSHCAEFAEKGFPTLRDKYVNSGKISFEMRNYIRDPLDMTASLLARCGGAEPFFPLSDELFGYQATLFEKAQGLGEAGYKAALESPANERFVKLGQSTGLVEFVMQRGVSEDQAKQCLSDSKSAEKLAENVQKAGATYQIEGTPTFLMNGQKLDNVSSWPALEAKLREAGA